MLFGDMTKRVHCPAPV